MRPIVPINCFFKGSYNPAYEREVVKCKDKCWQYISLHPHDKAVHDPISLEHFGKRGKQRCVRGTFYLD